MAPPASPAPPLRRALDAVYGAGFVLYAAGLVLWLAVGVLPVMLTLGGPLRDSAMSLAAGHSGLADAAHDLLAEQPSGAEKATWALQYLFSTLNAALGLLLASRLFRQLEGRLLALAFIGTAATFNSPSHVVFHLLGHAPPLTAVHFAFHVLSGTTYLWAVVLFPHGRLPGDVPRRVAVPVGALATGLVAWICWRSSFIQHPPFFVAFFGVLVPVVGITAQTVRIRGASSASAGSAGQRPDPVTLQQARLLRGALLPALVAAVIWLLLHLVSLLGGMSTVTSLGAERLQTWFPGLFAVIPVALFVAILRRHLWDLDLVLSKALLVTFVTGAVSVLYLAVLTAAAAVTGGLGWSAAVAVALVAVAVEPVRRACTRLANRVVFGQELPPAEALRRLTDRLARSDGSDELADVAEAIVAGTRATAASVWVRQDDDLVAVATFPRQVGPPPGTPDVGVVLPIQHDGVALGALAVETPPGVDLPAAEQRLVARLATHAGMLVANALLTRSLMDQVSAVRARRRELVASRRAVVMAQDAERRRLERDLHDGAQQELVAFLVHASTLSALARTGRPLDDAALAPVRELLRSSSETVAALARGGAPQALLDGGLPAALRAAADRAATAGTQVSLDWEVPTPVDPVVARTVYLTCTEALQNAAKHARASRIRVFGEVTGDDLHFGVTDDGVGFDPAAAAAGSGIDSIGRRVVEAGGVAELTSAPGRGTRLECRLPIAVPAPGVPAQATEPPAPPAAPAGSSGTTGMARGVPA